MTGRVRWIGFGAVLVLVTALVAVFIVRSLAEQERRMVPTAATRQDEALDLGSVLDAPHVVFRSTAPGPTYGRLAAVPLAHPGGERSVSGLACDRVYATATDGVCLAADRGAITTYTAELLDDRLASRSPLAITGIPSRTRLSTDGSRVAITAFTSGHGYGTIAFSTATTITDPVTGENFGNLEKTFTVLVDGKKDSAADLNIWGVTFAPGPRPTTFYATVASGGSTWLARGDLSGRTLTAIRKDAECPSLSPDGRTVVYKKRAGSPITWRYHVLDLETGIERALSETRSIDDQAEWLDDRHVLYGLARAGSGATDVWVDDVRPGAGRPRIFIPNAWSPAVVRGSTGDPAANR